MIAIALRSSVREDLERHGVTIGPRDTPRHAAGAAQRRLRRRGANPARASNEGEIPLTDYAQHVWALKARFPLLGLPWPSGTNRWRGTLALAATVTAGALGLQVLRHLEAIRGYRAPSLPAFDAYVRGQRRSTRRCSRSRRWGHRILTPWLAAAVPFLPINVAFPMVTIGSFALACLLLFAFLRRRGHRPWAASLGAAAPSRSRLRSESSSRRRIWSSPWAARSSSPCSWPLEMGAGVVVLALVAVLGVLTKEALILFLPVVYFASAKRAARARRA